LRDNAGKTGLDERPGRNTPWAQIHRLLGASGMSSLSADHDGKVYNECRDCPGVSHAGQIPLLKRLHRESV
jgi:hypothetical protein